VVVKLLVDPRGRVQRKSIVEATPEGIFDGCVLDAVAQWRFKPGYYKGQPVSTWVVTPHPVQAVRQMTASSPGIFGSLHPCVPPLSDIPWAALVQRFNSTW
jgi:TonB family protein